MAKLVLASALARWMPEATTAGNGEVAMQVAANTIGGVLEGAFVRHPSLRGYVLDEHGSVRHHVAIFIDGVAIRDRALLQSPLADSSEVYVMQALSGG